MEKDCNDDEEKERNMIEALRNHIEDFENLNEFWHHAWIVRLLLAIGLLVLSGIVLYVQIHDLAKTSEAYMIFSALLSGLVAVIVFLSLLLTGILNFRFWKLVVDVYVSKDMNTESALGDVIRQILLGKDEIGYQIFGVYIGSGEVVLFATAFSFIYQFVIGKIVESAVD